MRTAFRPTTTIIITNRSGWNRAAVHTHTRISDTPFIKKPFVEDAIKVYPEGLVLRPGVDDPVMLVDEAQQHLATDPSEAGLLYQRARRAFDAAKFRRGDLYVAAVMGEARWCDALNGDTLKALDRVRILARNDAEILRQESMVRAAAYFKMKNPIAALAVLEDITLLGDAPHDVTTAMAMVAKVDIHLSQGIRSTHDLRERSFSRARDILLGDYELPYMMPDMLSEVRACDGEHGVQAVTETLAMLYADTAAVFMEYGYSRYAHEVLAHVLDEFNRTAVAKKIMRETEGPLAQFMRDGSLIELGDVADVECRRARLVEALHNCTFATRGDAWKVVGVGGVCGALADLALGGGAISYPDMVQGIALGATGALAGVKMYLGWTSPEARQAGETGYSANIDNTWGNLKVGGGEFLKLLGTYAFFGGLLPGIGLLSDYTGPDFMGKLQPYAGPSALLTHADGHWGQLRGPGAFIGAHLDALFTHGGILVTQGWSTFHQNLVENTVFGRALNNAYLFWKGAFEYASTDMPADLWRATQDVFTFRDTWDSVTKIWKGLAAAYTLTMIVAPTIREGLINKDAYHIKKILPVVEFVVLMPMAYMLAHDINVAVGVQEGRHAWGIPAMGAISQLRQHWMGGGRWNNIDGAKMMGSFLSQTLYAGTGAQMLPDAMDKGSLWDVYQASMGVQIGLQLIAIPQAKLHGWSLRELLKIKAGQSWREETPANLGRIVMKWDSLEGTAFSVMFQQVALKSWIGSWRKEQTGTSLQRNQFRRMMRPRNDVDMHFEQAMTRMQGRMEEIRQEARRLQQSALEHEGWNYWRAYRRADPRERLGMITALYAMPSSEGSLFPAKLSIAEYKQNVYDVLISSATPSEAVEDYLKDLDALLTDFDPRQAEFRYNLTVATWAAQQGFHGGLIETFFDQRPHLKQRMVEAKVGQPWGWKFWWFRNRLKMKDEGADQLESSMMQAGMSVPYWNFLTGDSSVERKPYLTMLMMSMMRKDPPYPTNVLEKTYRNLYQMLISKKRRVGLKDVEIAQFLADLEGIIYKTDEKRRYVRRNLLVTAWAAGQVGPHATQINTFFARHAEHIRKWYGIDPHRDEKLGNPPVKHRGKEARRWFKQNLEGSDLQADGTYRERRGLIARLRKRRIKHVDEKNK